MHNSAFNRDVNAWHCRPLTLALGRKGGCLLRGFFFLNLLIVSRLVIAASGTCDLSPDEPNQCLARKLNAAQLVHKQKVALLKQLVSERIDGDQSGTRFAESVAASEKAWEQTRQANCSVVEAAYYDGSARVNAITSCELDELEARNSRLVALIREFGGGRHQLRTSKK